MSMTGQRSTNSDTHPHDEGIYRAQLTAMAAGVALGVVGVLGFIPGVTQHVPFKAGERFSGPASHAMLFGVFQTSVLANLIFLGFAILGGVSGFFRLTARLYFFVGAVVFAFFAVYGLSIDRSSAANFLPMNAADTWFHLGIAVVMLAIGLGVSRRPPH